MKIKIGSVLIGLAGWAVNMGAHAAELQVYVPGAVRPAVLSAAATFQRDTGHSVNFTFGTGGGTQQQVAKGAPADVTVLPGKSIDELEQLGLIMTESRRAVGALGVGVGIKAGKPRPAIGSEAELRATLLAARSLSYADPALGGTAGVYFATVVLPRLGIVEDLRAKTLLGAVGQDAVHHVVNGEAEIVVVQASEIVAVPGAELVGPLPKSLQKQTPYAAVALKRSLMPEVARAYIEYLVSVEGKAAFRAAGFQVDDGAREK